MYIHVLGSGAGGGLPQWNCNCPNCKAVRNGDPNIIARTQSSIAVSGDGIDWVIFNTSPDILTQLKDFPALQPARELRDTAIKAVLFIDSQIDHTTGLLMLREGCPHQVYCSDMVYQDLTTGFPMFKMLEHWNGGIQRHSIPLEENSHFEISGVAGLRFRALPVTGKAPPYSPHRHAPEIGDNIGISIEDTNTGKTVFYAPGLAKISAPVQLAMENADCLLVDGTFWRDDEMAVVGLGDRKASDMGHLPQSGAGGMIEALAPLSKPRKILIHINNTNPILNEVSAERKILEQEGIEVAFDGMDIEI